jgi:hypothetical protein
MNIKLLLDLTETEQEETLFGFSPLRKICDPSEVRVTEKLNEIISSSTNDLESQINSVDLSNRYSSVEFDNEIKYANSLSKLEGIHQESDELESTIEEIHEWGSEWKDLCLSIIQGKIGVNMRELLSCETLIKLDKIDGD